MTQKLFCNCSAIISNDDGFFWKLKLAEDFFYPWDKIESLAIENAGKVSFKKLYLNDLNSLNEIAKKTFREFKNLDIKPGFFKQHEGFNSLSHHDLLKKWMEQGAINKSEPVKELITFIARFSQNQAIEFLQKNIPLEEAKVMINTSGRLDLKM